MTQEEYYKAPKQEVFDEIKKAAMELWPEIDPDNDKYGYATEKINRIKDIKNVQDNAWYIVAMFDYNNQRKLIDKLTPETAAIVEDVIKGV